MAKRKSNGVADPGTVVVEEAQSKRLSRLTDRLRLAIATADPEGRIPSATEAQLEAVEQLLESKVGSFE